MYAAVILCACTIAVASCSKNPVDKFCDKADALFARIDKLAEKDNPSKEEIKSLMEDTKEVEKYISEIQSNEKLADAELTTEQQTRLLAMVQKFQALYHNPDFRHLREMAVKYNLKY